MPPSFCYSDVKIVTNDQDTAAVDAYRKTWDQLQSGPLIQILTNTWNVIPVASKNFTEAAWLLQAGHLADRTSVYTMNLQYPLDFGFGIQ